MNAKLQGIGCISILTFTASLIVIVVSAFAHLTDSMSMVDHWRRGEMLYTRNALILATVAFLLLTITEILLRRGKS